MLRHFTYRSYREARPTILSLAHLLVMASVLASLVFALGPVQPVFAAGPFTVNTTNDTHCSGFSSQAAPGCTAVTDSGGHISLRSALEEANTAGGTTTINLPAGTYNLSLGDLVAGTQANTTINVQGAGAATTIINQTTAGRMVFNQNYNVNSNVVFNLSGVTVSGGSENEQDPDGFGGNGGAILGGGGGGITGVAMSFTNVVFSGNFCSPVSNAGCSGGAISMTGGGNLTVTGSTFTGNTASKNSGFGSGGAIYFDNGGNGGNVSITNSTFTNNTAQGNSTTGGQGGAVRLSGGTGTTYTLTNNTFTGNAANGTAGAGANGGAITLISGAMTANFNRIVGNSSASGSGLFVASNAGTVGGATNNWWGCNGDPSANAVGCDTAVFGSGNQGGSMTVNPWIVLSNTASPNPIQVNQTTTLTADFLHNSSGGSLLASQIPVLLGLPVTWGSAVKGALSNTVNSIQANGSATATFTASAAGAGSAGATVDHGTGTASITINKADTSTTISGDSPDPSVTGEPVSFVYGVTSATGIVPTAFTGTVTVGDGTDSCTGSATGPTFGCQVSFMSAGTKTVTATYGGDANFNVSTSTTSITHTVNKADTTATITTVDVNPSVVGQSVTINYGVSVNSPGSGTPTGNVTVSDGSVSCTASVSTGKCSITFTSAGAKSLTATYAGDANYNASPASAAFSQQVNKADTTTSITQDIPDPSGVSQSVTVNYTVAVNSPGAGSPTGNVTVSDGVDSCTGTVAAGTCSTTLTTAGSRTLTATYAGDSDFNGSTSAGEPHSVIDPTTATTIISDNPDPSVVGQSVPVQYTVSANGGTPTGNVTVSDGTVSCTGTVAAGQCSLTFTSAGAKSLTASYAGDSTFHASTSAAESHQVNPADTTTTITQDNPDPSTAGVAVTAKFSVTVNAPGAGTATGNVTVSDGVDSCTGTVAAGQCDITLNTTGSRTLTAVYAGDANFNGSTSAGEAHTVNGLSTTTTLNAGTPNPSVAGQAVSFSYSVTASSGTPTGTVTVTDGTESCTATVVAGSCQFAFPSAGAKSVTATYNADSPYADSTSSSVQQTVNKADTTIAVSPSPNPVTAPNPFAASAQVTVNSPGSGTPTGTVAFYLDGNPYAGCGSVSLDNTGKAICTINANPGFHSITAVYSGENNFNSSTSAPAPEEVDSAPAITSANTTTFVAGSAGSFSVTTSGFPAPSLSESGALPGGVTFTDNGNGTATLAGTPAAGSGGVYNLTFTATNSAGSAPQNFTLIVKQAPVITSASTTTFNVGSAGTFSVTTTGFPAPSLSESGALPAGVTFVDNGNGTATLSGTPAAGSSGVYNLLFTAVNGANPNGTQSFTLKVGVPPSVTLNPVDVTVPAGQTATFTAAATGNPTPTVQWQQSTDGGATFTNVAGATSTTLSFTASASQNGYKYRAVFTNGAGTATTSAAKLTVQVPTSLLYNGGQIVVIGSTFVPAAQLTSSNAICSVSGQTITFSLDRNPLTGVSGSYSLGTAQTGSSGQATMAAVSTTGWQEGVYTVTATFATNGTCIGSTDTATLTAAGLGDSANGGGWYTLSGSGRINFGFTVSKVLNSCTSNCAYKGQLLLINNSKWRLKGNLTGYVKSTTSAQGSASGTGALYWWNQSLNGGLGGWVLASSSVNFTISFYDGGTAKKTDTFGINIQYKPVSPQPGTLPNSTPQPLKGGNIVVK